MPARQVAFPSADVNRALTAFRGQRIVVLGDVMLDRYWWGSVRRISPEAPVPVVEVSRETVRLGGAANVAANVRSLGGVPLLMGVVGEDAAGEALKSALGDQGLAADQLLPIAGRPTTQKTRIIAHHQQVVRADQEDVGPLPTAAAAALKARVLAGLSGAGALIVSDYGKGVVDRDLLLAVLESAAAERVPVCVDPKESHFDAYGRATVITPNLAEAGGAYGRRITDEAGLEEVGFGLLRRLGCGAVLITRSEQGMSLFESPAEHTYFPTVAQEVYDVTGAGDTVVATLAMALAAGADLKLATLVSNHAAGLVIREIGTAATTVGALTQSLARNGDQGAS
jgi:D-beta-D-heptose 7-phosphate kinase/D-beta-D-heptose 1-phosphate adenosyltransferase